ncbi:MAG TPA: CFI-box-CTERM domain-containing protein [Nitrosopumilaceae archaeon]|nr:CFI-box-CTERM domain-containing protein [Nitrosopumilaceae archaeon]
MIKYMILFIPKITLILTMRKGAIFVITMLTVISGINFISSLAFAQDLGMDSLQQQMQSTVQGSEDTAASMVNKVQDSSTEAAKYSGCLIATASFGSELAPQVQMLRETRDNMLLQTRSGTTFMTAFNQFYYTFSPTVAEWERQNAIFKEIVKTTITPLITTLSILSYLNIDSEMEMIGYGVGVILLNIGMYFVFPAFVVIQLKSRVITRKQNRINKMAD